MHALTTVILAAGEGKRMRSRQPKVLHELCGRPLISYSLRLARAVGERIVLVVGPDADAVNSLDRYEAALWFLSRGDECLNCETGLDALTQADGRLIIRVRKS